jgi:hypothetical protein
MLLCYRFHFNEIRGCEASEFEKKRKVPAHVSVTRKTFHFLSLYISLSLQIKRKKLTSFFTVVTGERKADISFGS